MSNYNPTPTTIQNNEPKQNSLILVLNQETVSSKLNDFLTGPLSFLADLFGANHSIQLHLCTKWILNLSQINITIGNSYLTYKSPKPSDDAIFIKNITVKTFTESTHYLHETHYYKKGFSFNFKSNSDRFKEYEIDQELTIEGVPGIYNNPISVELQNNKKIKIEVLLSDGKRFHSDSFSINEIDGSHSSAKRHFFESKN